MAIKIKKKDQSEGSEEEAVEEQAASGATLTDDADPILRASWETASWVEENRGLVLGGIFVVLIAVIGGYFGLQYLESQKVKASSALTPAIESYTTLIEGSREIEAIKSNPDIEAPEKTYESDEAKWQDVYDNADKALAKHPNSEIANASRLAKAAAALKLGKTDEAIELYTSYLESPTDPSMEAAVLQGLATAHANAENWDDATATLDKLGELDEAYAEAARYQKARILERAGKADEAKKLYHEILDEDPNHPQKADIERRLANM